MFLGEDGRMLAPSQTDFYNNLEAWEGGKTSVEPVPDRPKTSVPDVDFQPPIIPISSRPTSMSGPVRQVKPSPPTTHSRPLDGCP